MKRNDLTPAAVIFAALTIIGCSVSSIRACRKRRVQRERRLELAQQDWEAEGGAVLPDPEEQSPLTEPRVAAPPVLR